MLLAHTNDSSLIISHKASLVALMPRYFSRSYENAVFIIYYIL